MRVPYLASILSSLLLYLGWVSLGNTAGAFLTWASAILLIEASSQSAGRYLPLYLAGIVLNLLGFHWLFHTISDFGGFSLLPTALIFALFIGVSSVQYLVYAFIFNNLPSFFERYGLRATCAWISAELVSFRIFPWQYAHTQLGFPSLAQIADLAGTVGITFIMFWVCEGTRTALRTKRVIPFALSGLILVALLFYGHSQITRFRNLPTPTQEVALLQANISLVEKHDVRYFAENTEEYVRLTQGVAHDGLFVIWPETVIQNWIPVDVGSAQASPYIPQFEERMHLLTGALTYSSDRSFYNSALAVYADGRVPVPSHKIILMPYGEYTPLSDIFPWMSEINRGILNFTPGDRVKIFHYPRDNAQPMRVAALICYEDVIASLARQATADGAQLLVNLTNDAWFGESLAPYHHNLIASFRAIENRRFLLRATNSGLTAVINPLGETIEQLPTFSEGTLLATVNLMSYTSIYTRLIGEKPWWILCTVSLLCVVYRKFKLLGSAL